MVKRKVCASAILFALYLFPTAGHGQAKVLTDSVDTKMIIVAKEIIAAAGICTLISIDEEGNARARAMDAFPPDNNFIIWFGTNPKSRKVIQIQHNSSVTLYFFDKATASYVTIHGEAEIISSQEEKGIHWKEEWHNFYPDYPENYALIKVTPEWMEVLSESRGIIGDPLTWQPPVVRFKN